MLALLGPLTVVALLGGFGVKTASFVITGLQHIAFDVPPIQFGQAALLGQMTADFPVSPLTPATFLVVGLMVPRGGH
jgi:Mg2+/citrate symporter